VKVAVIGGGWAGCAAAVALARRGHRVELLEAAPVLGGRARTVLRDGLALDNGQHLLLGAYTDTRKLVADWEKENFKIPLKVIESPYREITKPVLDYVKRVKSDNPRDVVTVFIPEYVVGHWWEQLLHNQSALRLKGRLLFQPGVMVTSVPWQLASSVKVRDKDVIAPGARPLVALILQTALIGVFAFAGVELLLVR